VYGRFRGKGEKEKKNFQILLFGFFLISRGNACRGGKKGRRGRGRGGTSCCDLSFHQRKWLLREIKKVKEERKGGKGKDWLIPSSFLLLF